MEALMRQFGSILSALAMIGVALLVVMVGLRPVTRALIEMREAPGAGALALPGSGADALDGRVEPALLAEQEAQALIEDANFKRNKGPQKRLEQLVEIDEAQAVAILKQWIRHGERL
jgi:flagellar M-ring protein FliF